MRSKTKNRTLALLAASSALCLGGALALYGVNAVEARAAETNYYAFVNVGADADAAVIDEALGLTAKGATATTAGTVTAGGSLFTSYAENAAYSLALADGTYQVAVAVIAEAGTAVTVGGTAAAIPAGTQGKYVVSTTATVSGGSLAVAVTGKLCGILVTGENEKVLMTADYTEGQVVQYGALLSEELENATGYYSDGTSAELPIHYENITAGSGVNVNFTTIDVSGMVGDTGLRATRYVTTMPDDLVYFINSGSNNVPGKYEDFADPSYSYNRTVFDYYGESLKNYGTPDAVSTKGGDTWGCYTETVFSAPGDATFPYNTLLWTETVTDMGYMLTNLTPNANYRIYIGTLSHWHARTVDITFNGQVVGANTLRIASSKGCSVYENVPADANGKIDLHMQGASTNEPCICFIAVQSMDTAVSAVPSVPQGADTVGMEDHSMTLTGLSAGAKVQMYSAAKPFQLIYEEMVDEAKIGEDGSYLLDWGEPATVSQFNVVQVSNGGASEALLVSVTDIEEFEYALSTDGYTTGSVTVSISAHADSGIASWSYRLGEYGAVTKFDLDIPYSVNGSFTVSENGDYYVTVTSGLGVTNLKIVTIDNIDPDRPVITLTPSANGWQSGSYNVSLTVDSIAPVNKYTLYKNGAEVASANEAPASIRFAEEGEYVIYVQTAAGRSATGSVVVSANPTTTAVKKTYANRTLKYTFGNTDDYEVASVTVYELKGSGVSRMTIASGNSMDVYNAGKYVAMVTSKNGTMEMFSLEVKASDFKSNKATSNKGGSNGLGVGLGVGIGGVVVAAAAIVVTVVLLKKKKS